MRVLFIFKNENFIAPIGPMYVSAAARKAGHETSLVETHQEDPMQRIAAFRPNVVAFSASTGETKNYLKLCQRIKEEYPHIFTIMGGPHPTFFPEVLKEGYLDAICVGEGEEAFVDVLNALAGGRSPRGIPNIMTPGDASSTVRRLVEDLDTLPMPDWGLMYDNTPMGRYPLKSIMVSRGCPYPCTYCFNHAWRGIYRGKGRVVRRHSVEYSLEMVERVKAKWPLTTVKFYDDNFCFQVDDWLVEFCHKYRERIGLPFFILIRADLLTEEMVKLLKYAGVRTISMSIEAGNPRVRNELLKRGMTNEQIIKAHRLCDEYGIYTFTNCIIGLPGTTMKEDIESLELCLESRVTWSEFLVFHPYPRTELGDQTIALGMYSPDYERMHTSYQFASPLTSFTRKEKDMQRNLAVLGPVVVVHPWLRDIIVRWLLPRRHSKLFTLLYYLVKMRVIRGKIYVTRTSRWESLRIYLRSLRQEIFRHTPETPEVGYTQTRGEGQRVAGP